MQEAKFWSFSYLLFSLTCTAPPTMVYGTYPGNKKSAGMGHDYSAKGFNSFF